MRCDTLTLPRASQELETRAVDAERRAMVAERTCEEHRKHIRELQGQLDSLRRSGHHGAATEEAPAAQLNN